MAIEAVVRSFDELSDEYEVVVQRAGDQESITLKVEPRAGQEGLGPEALGRLKDRLRLETNLGYAIEVHAPGSLTRYEVKARRFKDLRKDH